MPLVQITVAAGRTEEQLRALLSEVHDAVVHSLSAPPQSVRVLVTELPPEHWSSGGVTLAEKAAQQPG